MATNGDKQTNGNSTKRDNTAQRIIEAIKHSDGLLTDAAKKAHVGYTTLWRYTKDYSSVEQAVKEAKETMLDFAESKLYGKIRDGDNTAIIFFLKTQGKARGYIERQELTGANGGPIGLENNASNLSDEELEAIIKGRSSGGATKKEQGS